MKRTILLINILIMSAVLWAGGQPDVPGSEADIKADKPISTERSLINMVEEGDAAAIERELNIDVDLDAGDEEGRTALHAAAESGNAEIVRILLFKGASVDPVDNRGRTPLLLALDGERSSVIKALIRAGADFSITDEEGLSPGILALEKPAALLADLVTPNTVNKAVIEGDSLLHEASARGLEAHVSVLLNQGADPATRNDDGRIALDAALENSADTNRARIAAILLKNGSPRPRDDQWFYITEPLRTGDFTQRFDYGSTVLHIAAERGHEDMLRYFIANSADVNSRDQPGNTALHAAVRKGYRTMAAILLDAGADVNARDNNGNAPIHESLTALDGNAMAEMLLDRGANVNAKNGSGSTPLHLTVLLSGSADTGRLLLDRGAAVDIRDKNGNTPLLLAVQAADRNLAELFLSEGAVIFARNNQELTPVETALSRGADVVSWFFTGNRLTETDNEGRSVLHHAVSMGVETETLRILLYAGAQANLRDLNGETALHYAVARASVDGALALMDFGGDLFLEDNDGRSPLIFAFDQGPKTTLALLQNRLDTEDDRGGTPLFHAVQWSYTTVIDALLAAGADPEHQNRQGGTPLHEAVHTGDVTTAKKLIMAGANPNRSDTMGRTPLHDAVIWDDFEMVRLLIDRGADTDVRDGSGQTALHMAAFSGNKMIAKWLLDAGASSECRSNDGRTPLFIAVESGRVETTGILISGGANLTARDNEGRTALHTAIAAGMTETAARLIEAGADIFAMDMSGRSPFDLAFDGDPEIFGLLLTPQVVNKQDNMGNSPLHRAVTMNADRKIISLLLERGANKKSRNAAGETAYDLAIKLDFADMAALLR